MSQLTNPYVAPSVTLIPVLAKLCEIRDGAEKASPDGRRPAMYALTAEDLQSLGDGIKEALSYLATKMNQWEDASCHGDS